MNFEKGISNLIADTGNKSGNSIFEISEKNLTFKLNLLSI